ncbi:MAG TPA: glycosyltransferase, partial [Vicinamibacterales bacterium]|nr:glycosyltransferase [Vicinamibacterales bacterium]
MHLCVVSFKPCWQDRDGRWMSSGGFPRQMAAVASLFDRLTLVVVRTDPQAGGLPLPPEAEVVALRSPSGAGGRRKVSVLAGLGYYLGAIAPCVRRADVVHVPVPGDISFLGFLVALAFRKRLIVRYGSCWTVTPHTTWMQRLTRACMRVCAGGRNVMLATGVGAAPPAPGIRWIFSTALSRAEVDAIDVCLDRLPGRPPRLVYIGRLSPEKGVDCLLRAVALLRRAGWEPMPRLSLLGDGPQRASLERQARELEIADLVAFCGQLDRRQLFAHLRDADLGVQPSLTEAFSKAALDAMAHGVPVLSSNVGSATSIVGTSGERGWLIPPGD